MKMKRITATVLCALMLLAAGCSVEKPAPQIPAVENSAAALIKDEETEEPQPTPYGYEATAEPEPIAEPTPASQGEETALPSISEIPKQTDTPQPVVTPAWTADPTYTPKPSAAPQPTGTPIPTASQTPAITAAPTQGPTASPRPTTAPTPAITATPTPRPTATPTPRPTATSAPTPSPAPTPTPAADVLQPIEYYVQYAVDYALSRGLYLDESASVSWDTPLIYNPNNPQCHSNLIRDIKSRIDRYIELEGISAVWVWYDNREFDGTILPNGKLYLYIGRG